MVAGGTLDTKFGVSHFWQESQLRGSTPKMNKRETRDYESITIYL